MHDEITMIGCVFITIICIAIPFLLPISFIYEWGVFINWVLTIMTLIDWVFICSMIWYMCEHDKKDKEK